MIKEKSGMKDLLKICFLATTKFFDFNTVILKKDILNQIEINLKLCKLAYQKLVLDEKMLFCMFANDFPVLVV